MLKNLMRSKFRRVLLFLFDLLLFVLIAAAYHILSREPFFESYIGNKDQIMRGAIVFSCMFGTRLIFGIYNTVWRYTTTSAYIRLILADFMGFALGILISYLFVIQQGHGILKWTWNVAALVSMNLVFSIFSRKCYRLLYKRYRYKK